jgi:hypothetical protein
MEALKTSAPELYDIYQNQGYEAFLVASNDYQAQWERNFTKLPDGQYISNDSLSTIKTQSPMAYSVLTEQGYNAYQKAVTDAKFVLAPFQEKGEENGDHGEAETGSEFHSKLLPLFC